MIRTESFAEIAAIQEDSINQIMAAKEAGKKLVGYYCNYTPIELVIAAGHIVVPLCASQPGPLVAADNDLPQNLCPIVRTIYNVSITDKCPYFHLCDLVITETTCDGKKKVYELMQKIKPIHTMNLPQIPDLPSALSMWESEIRRLKIRLEQLFETEITDDMIRRAIRITNKESRARKAVFDLNQSKPALLSGAEALTIVTNADYAVDRLAVVHLLDNFKAEISGMAKDGHHVGDARTPRVLLTGCPIGDEDDKVLALVEECGGLVVVMENCGAYKTVHQLIDENDTRDPILLLAEKYLKVPCSVMTPNAGRLQILEQMIRDFQIDGVIDLTWQACHTYNIESYLVSELVKNKLGKIYLHLETNFSESDIENLRVRIEAFVEMLR